MAAKKGELKTDWVKTDETRLEEQTIFEGYQGLSPTDAITTTLDAVYGDTRYEDAERGGNRQADAAKARTNPAEGQAQAGVDELAMEDTPVDSAAPPTVIIHGTDVLNGYNGGDKS
ncbi:hypothetical protein [Paenibacillus xerothermodurans]|uniref:Uncharacterized protein n=1 Tax=Paenibacillus xerothermodurans TaxID=1977292 RepID=A0A2W1N9R5_PAEXE|nr:hypothetical protein [Paenibacillus xerothermodurans]PZE20674.1 hypothetical protein CBW46_010880 [Paenibacillus xerothermodurans]